jgi:hypothetical protein
MTVPAAGVAKNHGKTDACGATGWNTTQTSRHSAGPGIWNGLAGP